MALMDSAFRRRLEWERFDRPDAGANERRAEQKWRQSISPSEKQVVTLDTCLVQLLRFERSPLCWQVSSPGFDIRLPLDLLAQKK